MNDEKINAQIDDQDKVLTIEEMDDVAGGAGKYYIVICKNGCGYMKAFDNYSDAWDYASETTVCPNCGYDKENLIII